MTIYCLICNSTAVLSKQTTTTTVMLVGTLEQFIHGLKEAQPQSAEEPTKSIFIQWLDLIGQGVSRATTGYMATLAFAEDVQKYQFSHYHYLCLRCGALFNQSAGTETASATGISPASDALSDAQPTLRPSADPQGPVASATD